MGFMRAQVILTKKVQKKITFENSRLTHFSYPSNHGVKKSRINKILCLKNMYFYQKILNFRHHNMVFLSFQLFSRRYTILSNNVKNSVFQTMQHFVCCLVPIVRKECHRNSIIFRRKLDSLTIHTWKNLCFTEFSTYKYSLKCNVGCF